MMYRLSRPCWIYREMEIFLDFGEVKFAPVSEPWWMQSMHLLSSILMIRLLFSTECLGMQT
jgi:hypothetical protein